MSLHLRLTHLAGMLPPFQVQTLNKMIEKMAVDVPLCSEEVGCVLVLAPLPTPATST